MRSARTTLAARNPRRALLAVAIAGAIAVLGASPERAAAQAGGRTWMPLDESPPGAAAQVTLEAAASTVSETFLDVTIHGFWVESRIGTDGVTYQKIDVPGLDHLGIVGAPHLSIVRERLVIATTATAATLAGVEQLLPMRSFVFHLWPEPVPEMTGQFLIPEQFAIDPAIYASPAPYPTASGAGSPRATAFGSIPTSTIEAYPCSWLAAIDIFQVMPMSRWHFVHSGAPATLNPITRDRARLCEPMMLNWNAIEAAMPINRHDYQGEYLFVHHTMYSAALKPLIAQKKWRGFNVSEVLTDTLGGASCEHVKNAIRNWCRSTPSEHDHYALLVGQFGDILMCNVHTDLDPEWTDDVYGSLRDDTLAHDIFVGRLSTIDAADLSRQITKILNYEDHPVSAPVYYGDVLLVAHEAGFQDVQDTVRTRPYAVAPNFFPYYGATPGHNNLGLTAHLNAGYGIVCYRGHGGSGEWWRWDRTGSCQGGPGECFTSGNVDALSNGALTSVVWSIACNNGDITKLDCMGTHWMSRFPGGAVSHYGATTPSNSWPNDDLEIALFNAVWDRGITTQSHAIAFAEDKMMENYPEQGMKNAYVYTLLGDPEMQIRRTVQAPWTVVAPGQVSVSPGGGEVSIHVVDGTGLPVVGALVSLWKPASGTAAGATISSGVDEVAVNLYSGSDGFARLPVNPQTTGYIYMAVRDSAGNSAVDSIAVNTSTGVDGRIAARPTLSAVPSIARSTTRWAFGAPLSEPGRVEIFATDGRRVAALDAGRGVDGLEWRAADASGRALPNGIYFARLRSGAFEARARVAVVR
jgi:hypothetical protein